ncbi:MAG TPA: nucleotidyltransferase domain-containing protein, partial [Acidilobales archaeon]|nr:nucleotidyltransferase domain-containing protein [Acidilobales archaeon]
MLKNYREIVKEVKGVVKEIDPSAEVYVFGSVVRGTYTA